MEPDDPNYSPEIDDLYDQKRHRVIRAKMWERQSSFESALDEKIRAQLRRNEDKIVKNFDEVIRKTCSFLKQGIPKEYIVDSEALNRSKEYISRNALIS